MLTGLWLCDSYKHLNVLNQEIKLSLKSLFEIEDGTNFVVYSDISIWHSRVTARAKWIIEKKRPSKPFSKQKDGRFGLKWCCMQLLKPIPRQTDGHCCFKRCYMRSKNILSFIRTYQRCMQNIKVLSQDMWKVIRILNSPWIKNCWEVRQFLTEQKASKLNNNAKILFLNSI